MIRIASVLLLLLAACGQASAGLTPLASAPPHGMRLKSELELTAMMSKAVSITLDHARSGVTTSEHDEIFYPDGRYVRLGDRAATEGSYRIVGGRICVDQGRDAERPDCRFLAEDTYGGLFFWRGPNGGFWPIGVHPVGP